MAKKLDLPDLLHLISELPVSDIEKLTVRAIRTYRRLIENAEKQFKNSRTITSAGQFKVARSTSPISKPKFRCSPNQRQ